MDDTGPWYLEFYFVSWKGVYPVVLVCVHDTLRNMCDATSVLWVGDVKSLWGTTEIPD